MFCEHFFEAVCKFGRIVAGEEVNNMGEEVNLFSKANEDVGVAIDGIGKELVAERLVRVPVLKKLLFIRPIIR
jgi:hypothetical protein